MFIADFPSICFKQMGWTVILADNTRYTYVKIKNMTQPSGCQGIAKMMRMCP